VHLLSWYRTPFFHSLPCAPENLNGTFIAEYWKWMEKGYVYTDIEIAVHYPHLHFCHVSFADLTRGTHGVSV